MPKFDLGHLVGKREENSDIISSCEHIRQKNLTSVEEVELGYQALMHAEKEGEMEFAASPSSRRIAEGLHINWINMKDAETGEELWQSGKWEKCFEEELYANVPVKILDCDSVSREISFSSEEEIEEFRLEQRVFFNGVCIEEWFFNFGFVIKNSTNTWQQIIHSAKGQMKNASELSGRTIMWKTTASMVNGVLCGERRALSRAITLLESSRADHVEQAELLLDAVQQANKKQPFTVGICGPPGAGKSTFLERLGTQLTSKGHRISVVTVDPSSSFSGGALLGDRCRMDNLSKDPLAFIRSCPTRGVLGGVARYTQSVVQLCGVSSNLVFVESVGIGQSEIEASQTVDLLLLLLSPAGGDELQGSKKGIVESADLIVINKADGPLEKHAKRTAMDYKAALKFTRRHSTCCEPAVLLCSSLKDEGGVREVWARCEEFREKATMNGRLSRRRKAQGEYWMMKEMERCLSETVKKDPNVIKVANRLKEEVGKGKRSARNAGRCLAGLFHTIEQPQE